jgi:hypothetical protein
VWVADENQGITFYRGIPSIVIIVSLHETNPRTNIPHSLVNIFQLRDQIDRESMGLSPRAGYGGIFGSDKMQEMYIPIAF